MATVTPRESAEVTTANESGRQPVVFVHGLWLLAGSWDAWRHLFEESGYATVAVDWPDDPADREAAVARPEVFAGKSVAQLADHVAEVVRGLERKPVLIGHSFGGLLVQILAGRGLSAATVAVDPAPGRGVLRLPLSTMRASLPVLGNPLNRGRAVLLSFEQFRYAFANTHSENEARDLYETFHVPGAGLPMFQAAFANLNPRSELATDTENPERGPMLLIAGQEDHTVPESLTRAAYKRQRKNPGVTEIVEIPGAGHALVFDSNWRRVAGPALDFLARNGVTAGPDRS